MTIQNKQFLKNQAVESTVLISDAPSTYSSVDNSLSESSQGPTSIDNPDNDFGLLEIPNIVFIEASLFTNVFLSGFDSTVTASTYTTIGNYFNAVNLASWITTSYLVTSTAFQPLYGSISDVIGRRYCVFFSVFTFSVGCLGCGISPNIYILNFLRSLTGVGAAGLIALSTIVNSDIVPLKKRGLVQACQNLSLGMGGIFGAAFGGTILKYLGWRWCFLCQIPLCFWSSMVGYYYIQDQPSLQNSKIKFDKHLFEKIDIKGSFLVVAALTVILLFLTMGGNELAWSDFRLILLAILGLLLSFYFIRTELTTTSTPIMPIHLYRNRFTMYLLFINFIIGLASYAYLFALPQLFQIVLGDSPSQAGLRLAIPSLSTPIGGLTTGILMNKYSLLRSLVFAGTSIMTIGNFIALFVSPKIKGILLALLLVPANLGQGLCFPSSLFLFIFAYGPANHATSTSTTYLLRSIGGVFGVSGVSVIIQSYLKVNASKHLAELDLSHHEINKIVKKITKSTDNIYLLPENIKNIILQDYERGIRIAQFCTGMLCFLAVVSCVLSCITKSRPDHPSILT